MTPYWVTFYSYKGGVGRTLALVNSAVLLARSGRNVLLVDFDLEAPGLDSFAELGLLIGARGVVEYFAEFISANKAPQLGHFIQQPTPKFASRGKLFVMPSGRKDREYNRQRDAINWSTLYDSGFGQLMIAEWKASIAAQYELDYVFVDSRTGLTDIGGVCTLDLPDLVVTLLALNRQNVDGVASVISAIERAETRRRPIIITAATPVPSSSIDSSAVDDALSKAELVIGRKIDLRISYNSIAALSERIFVVESGETRTQLVLEYQDLVNAIKRRNSTGLDALLEQSEAARENDDERLALVLSETLQEDFGSRSDALIELAEVARRFRDKQAALDLWQRAFAQDSTLMTALNPLVNAAKGEENYQRVLELCDTYFTNPAALRDSDISVGVLKAEALMVLGRPADAVQYYAAANELDPDHLSRQFNLAEAIRRSTKTPDSSDWRKVIELFERTFRLNVQHSDVNTFQAMHIAYACLGDIEHARRLLNQATLAGKGLHEHSQTYSVRRYVFVKKSAILKDNEDFLAALDRGELWDGMNIPIDRAISSQAQT